jgi:hypothetical protein
MTISVFGKAMVRWVCQAVCLGVAAHGVLVAQRPPEVPSYESMLDPSLVKLHIADVGPVSISGIEFKLSYEFGPAFVKRVRDSKLRCLNFMVNEKLLALDAERIGLDKWPDVQRQVAEIEADLATEELYKKDVLKRVRVSDKRIASGIAAERVDLTVQWIFTKTPGEMDDCVRRLRSGVPFDTLFAAQFHRSPQPPPERSMTTTRFKLRLKNPLLAGIVDTMTAGTVSLPVHGPDGWYLVKIVDVQKNMVLTQTEHAKLADDVRRALIQYIGDSLSDAYVRTLVGSHHPTIMRGPLNALAAHMRKQYLDKARYDAWKLGELTGARLLADPADLGPMAHDTLVAMNTGCFTVADFLEWFRMREPYATLALSSPVALLHSVEDMIWRMVRDRLLTARAFARGFRTAPVVKQQTAWWKEKMLFTANKNRIGDTIIDSLPLLRKYYNENQRRFVDDSGHVKVFEDARDDVWKEYYSQELTRKMLHEVLRLRQKYGVRIDEAALRKIPVDNENDPHTIDVYPVKKGGIYPHAAFPSIDYDWQSWN